IWYLVSVKSVGECGGMGGGGGGGRGDRAGEARRGGSGIAPRIGAVVRACGTQAWLAHGICLGTLCPLGRAVPWHPPRRATGSTAVRALLVDSLRKDRRRDRRVCGRTGGARRRVIPSSFRRGMPRSRGILAPVTPDSSNRHSVDIEVQHGELTCSAFSRP